MGIKASAFGCLIGSLVGALLLSVWIVVKSTLLSTVSAPEVEVGVTYRALVAAYIFLVAFMGGAVLSAPVSLLFVLTMRTLSCRFLVMRHSAVWGILGALASFPIFLVLRSDPGLQFTLIESLILGLAGAAGGNASYRVIAGRA